MSLPLQVALTVAPLACYFYVVGIWQSGHRPRVIRGQVDFALLAFGFSGLLTVGPVGRVFMDLIFGTPTALGWTVWLAFLGVWTWFFSHAARRRLIVYNVRPETMRTAVADAVLHLRDVPLTPTLMGFESKSLPLSVNVETSKLLRVGTVEARGETAEYFIHRLRDPLRTEVRKDAVGPSRVTWLMFVLSWITLLAPIGVYMLTEPQARDALRAFLMRVRR